MSRMVRGLFSNQGYSDIKNSRRKEEGWVLISKRGSNDLKTGAGTNRTNTLRKKM